MKIEKKCWPEQFEALSNGTRSLELRLADFKVKAGDTIILREWDPKTRTYSGRELVKKVKETLAIKGDPYYEKKITEHYGFQVLLLG